MIRTAVTALLIGLIACLPGLHAGAVRSGTPVSQVERLLIDRPLIARALADRPHVRAWIERRFAETRPPLIWDSAAPLSGRGGEFDARDPNATRLRIAPDPSGIDQLSTLIFELHNVMGYGAFKEIHDRAVAGLLSRDEYARLMLQQEIVALAATREYLAAQVSALSTEEQRVARRYQRYRFGPATLDERIAEARQQGVDLLDHYRALYDTIVLSERKSR